MPWAFGRLISVVSQSNGPDDRQSDGLCSFEGEMPPVRVRAGFSPNITWSGKLLTTLAA